MNGQLLTKKEEDLLRISLFRLAYKLLGNENMNCQERFITAIVRSSPISTNLEDWPEIVRQWKIIRRGGGTVDSKNPCPQPDEEL